MVPDALVPAGGVTVADLRRANTTRVARALFRTPAATRADLARTTGLTRPTVRAAVNRLDADGMLARAPGSPEGGGGRPAELLRFNRRVATVAVVRDRSDHLELSLADLAGDVLATGSEPAPADPGHLARAVACHLGRLARSVPDAGPVRALAALEPGVVRHRAGGTQVTHPRRRWVDVPIQALLQAQLPGVAVSVVEPGPAALLGEPSLRPDVDAVFVLVDLGLGVSARANGSLVLGAHGAAGQIGHVVVDPGGRRCTCGRRGCLETLASGRAILDRLAELPDPVVHPHRPTLTELAALRRADVDAVVTAAAEHLGRALATVTSLYDPEVVVLGGTDFLDGATHFVETVRATAEGLRSRVDDGAVEYRLSTPDADVRGAVLQALGSLPDDLAAIVLDR